MSLLRKLFRISSPKSFRKPCRRLLKQTVIAGFQYYRGEQLWDFLRQDLPLQLRREPRNRFDCHAVAVYWNGNKLGFIPRSENLAIASLLDHGQQLEARIARQYRGSSSRRQVDVCVELLM